MRIKGIALKLSALILTSVLLIFALVIVNNYFFSRKIIIQNLENNAKHLALATINYIDSILFAVEKIPENLANFLKESSYDSNRLERFVRTVVENNPEIYGATVAFEPYAFKTERFYYAPYYFKNNGKLEKCYLGGDDYNYFHLDWYQIPKELDQPIWSEPFFDEGGGDILMATYSVPFYKTISGKRQFIGIVTADISLAWLQKKVSDIKILETGYGFLISKNGTIITHPRQGLVMNETIFSMAEALNDTQIRNLGREMIKGKTGFVPFTTPEKKKTWMVYAPLASNGWALAALFPEDELMADVVRLNHIMLILSLAGILCLLVIIILIAGTITRPLRALSNSAETIATGDLDVELPSIRSKDEVGILAESFAHMKASLKQYILDLTETTAAKERIESELQVARDIQMGILPKLFPPFPNRSEFDIYATIEPAKEVGGDLYDFFMIDEDHLCIVVGDVSGKGVPASLMMAITCTLIKTKTTKGLLPNTVLTRVNEDLSMDNESCMFVTLFLGILNLKTGEMAYCNAGHNYPYMIYASGDVAEIETTSGVALGVLEDFPYECGHIELNKDDTFFLYTDGVTEATNENDDQFLEERLEKTLMDSSRNSIRDIVSTVMLNVKDFSHPAPQFDDITIMALRFFGD